MRILFLLAIVAAALAQDLPITHLAGVSCKVADLEKARHFYTGLMGLEEAFHVNDSVFFKVNDDQFLEFSPAPVDGFQLLHVSFLTSDLRRMQSLLHTTAIAKAADGSSFVSLKDPGGNDVDFVEYGPRSKEAENRGKALGPRRISTHLQHMGLPADRSDDFMSFYSGKLGFRELFRSGPGNEIRWINLGVPGAQGEIFELMIMAAQPAQGRRHIAFEVPDMQAAYKELLARGLPAGSRPIEGPVQNHRWILNLRDPNGLRVEIMGEMVKP